MKNKTKILLAALTVSFMLGGCAGPVEEGIKALEAGEYKEAAEYFEKAASGKEKEEAAEGYRGLGFAYYEEGNYEEALNAFEKALDSGATQTVELYNLMGVCSMHLGNYEAALEAVRSGLAIAENSDGESAKEDLIREMRYNEIICCEKTADWTAAKEKMEQYLADYPDDEKAAREAAFLQTR